jgi:hypothetical protein
MQMQMQMQMQMHAWMLTAEDATLGLYTCSQILASLLDSSPFTSSSRRLARAHVYCLGCHSAACTDIHHTHLHSDVYLR